MAKIHEVRRGGVIIGYSVDLGVQPNGKRERRFHRKKEDAEKFSASYAADPTPIGVLLDRKIEILHCYNRLREVGSTFTEATEFFITHGARKGNPEIGLMIEQILKDKESSGRKIKYIDNLRKNYKLFAEYVNSDTCVGSISSEKIEAFVYKKNKKSSPVTKRNIIRNLNVLFKYAVDKKHIGINPVSGIEKPKVLFKVPSVMEPDDFKKLLECCYKNKWYDRLCVLVLVGFCGVRIEEASKLRWDNINFESGKVMVPATIAKTGSYRRNEIPRNAMIWLNAIRDERQKDEIISSGWEHLVRSAVIASGINYSKNCIRHSFCSYALAADWPLADVVAYMGHNRSPAIIAQHYRNLVEPEAAKRWWKIWPADVVEDLPSDYGSSGKSRAIFKQMEVLLRGAKNK